MPSASPPCSHRPPRIGEGHGPATDFELHLADSEVLGVVADAAAGVLTVQFSAAAARRAGDGAPGFLADVGLRFSGARWQGALGECLGRLVAGELRLADGTRLRHWPLHRTFDAPLRVELDFGRGVLLLVTAAGMVCTLGDSRFTESLAC
jgi:hypothetical protein